MGRPANWPTARRKAKPCEHVFVRVVSGATYQPGYVTDVCVRCDRHQGIRGTYGPHEHDWYDIPDPGGCAGEECYVCGLNRATYERENAEPGYDPFAAPISFPEPHVMEREAAIWVSPGRRRGEPCIYGHRMPTEQVARLVWTGGMDAVRAGWSYFTDEQILVACWYEVTHGKRRKWRKRFPDWPKRYDEQQWRNR